MSPLVNLFIYIIIEEVCGVKQENDMKRHGTITFGCFYLDRVLLKVQ